MRIYKHDRPGWIRAVEGSITIEVERARLPADPVEALAVLRERFDAARVACDPETGEPVPPPEPPEPEPELDVDDEAVQVADFGALAEQAAAEIEWLEATIPQIETMIAAEVRDVVKRLAQENLRCIRAWRYVFCKLV